CDHHGPVKKEDDHEPQVFINPEITWQSDERAKFEEGCLSIPDYYEEVDLSGKKHEIDAKGLLASSLQHEIDHINGVLFIDHLSKLKRDRVIKKFSKAARSKGTKQGGGVIGAPPIDPVWPASRDRHWPA